MVTYYVDPMLRKCDCVLHNLSAPDDYTSVSQDLTFQPGSERQCVDVPIVNDDDLENEEQFSMTITTEEDRVTLEPDSTTVTITDDDGENFY